MQSSIEVKGLKKLLKNSKGLADDLATEGRRVVISESNKMLDEMQRRAPKRTRVLEGAIKKRIWKDKHGITGMVIGVEGGHPEFTKGKSYYPASQEYGWTAYGIHHPGTPYIRPTFDNRAPGAKAKIRQKMKEVIDKARP